MKNVLIVKSSQTGDMSRSNKIIDHLVKEIKKIHPDWKYEEIDLSVHEFGNSHLSLKDNKGAEHLLTKDIIIFGIPLYNFSVSAPMKAYIDRVCRAGLTFNYLETGPIGMLTNKSFINVVARGGLYNDEILAKTPHGEVKFAPLDSLLITSVFGDFLGAKKVGEIVFDKGNIKDSAGNLVAPLDKWLADNNQRIVELAKKIV